MYLSHTTLDVNIVSINDILLISPNFSNFKMSNIKPQASEFLSIKSFIFIIYMCLSDEIYPLYIMIHVFLYREVYIITYK